MRVFKIDTIRNNPQIIEDYFQQVTPYGFDIGRLNALLDTLADDLMVVVECNYVDAVYRNAFYHYYATKFHDFSRECLKLSLFREKDAELGEVVLTEGQEEIDYSREKILKRNFLGFIVLRPINAILGRNVISVAAKKAPYDEIKICHVDINTTVLGLKVKVSGFPHASQDGEVMTCAETTVWSILEYYGNKYPKYKPVLPSDIREELKLVSDERQWPSDGLTQAQISRCLKNFGFNPKIYPFGYITKDGEVKYHPLMKEVLITYLQSGFPLALNLRLQNSFEGHAVVGIGIGAIEDLKKEETECTINEEVSEGNFERRKNVKNFYFVNQSIENIVVNDDNYPCYQKTNLYSPTSYYSYPDLKDMIISGFAVPLPVRIHKDAILAIEHSKNILNLWAPENSVCRMFLASCRSFREHIVLSEILSNENKNELISLDLPQFIWVTEFESKEEYEKNIVSGLIILDATQLRDPATDSLILFIKDQIGVGFDKETGEIRNFTLHEALAIEPYNRNIN